MPNLFDADYSAIEARIVCWLAGQEDALEEYRQGIDRYKVMASLIYNIPIEEVNKHPQRFIGKQTVLGCGFQQGASKFRMTCEKFGYKDMPLGLEQIAVERFREKHSRIKAYWYDVEEAAQKAILNKGTQVFVTNRKHGPYKVPVSFACFDVRGRFAESVGITFLLCKLPSGRKLAYPSPRLVPSRFEGKLAIKFFGNIKGSLWGDVDTYGGKLVENITQAVAADVMCQGAQNAELEGYEVMALIHDQALAYVQPNQTAKRFVACLTSMPPWAEGLPIEAEGGLVPFYKKD